MFQLRGTLRRPWRDDRGNVYILFAALAVPLLLVMGGAVEFARYARYKATLSNAVDSAALALARQHHDFNRDQAKTFVSDYVGSFVAHDDAFAVESIDVEKLGNGFLITANGSMKTIFLPLGRLAKNGSGRNTMAVNITAKVVNSSNRLELALVFDNTGSMNCGQTVSGSCAGNWSNPGTSSQRKSRVNRCEGQLMGRGVKRSGA